MKKMLPLVVLVSGLACGDTNNYYVGSGEDGKFTCQDACENTILVCGLRPENRMQNCLKDCGQDPAPGWDQKTIDCWSTQCEYDKTKGCH